jgi:hypothetical protein
MVPILLEWFECALSFNYLDLSYHYEILKYSIRVVVMTHPFLLKNMYAMQKENNGI